MKKHCSARHQLAKLAALVNTENSLLVFLVVACAIKLIGGRFFWVQIEWLFKQPIHELNLWCLVREGLGRHCGTSTVWVIILITDFSVLKDMQHGSVAPVMQLLLDGMWSMLAWNGTEQLVCLHWMVLCSNTTPHTVFFVTVMYSAFGCTAAWRSARLQVWDLALIWTTIHVFMRIVCFKSWLLRRVSMWHYGPQAASSDCGGQMYLCQLRWGPSVTLAENDSFLT